MPRRRSRFEWTAATIAAWWVLGSIGALLLATLRAAAIEAPVPYFRRIDLSRDIAWISARLPSDVAAFVAETAGDGSSGGWRMEGMHLREIRLGETRSNFVVYRRDAEGVVRRTPEDRIVVERLRRGFPFRCLEGDVWHAGMRGSTTQSLWRISRPAGPPDVDLPMRILWPGLVADGAITGCVLWLLARLPGFAERAFRRRRGRCAHCGHPLAGLSTCPECGLVA